MDNNLEMFCLDWRCGAKTLFPFARPRFFPTNEIPRVSTAAVHFGVGAQKISPQQRNPFGSNDSSWVQSCPKLFMDAMQIFSTDLYSGNAADCRT